MKKKTRKYTTPADQEDPGDQNCKSRMAKRKASPEKKTSVKRRRIAEQDGPSTSSDTHVVKGLKRKQDGEGTTNPAKKLKLLDHMSGDKEQASPYLDTDKDCSIDISQSCSKNKKACTKNGKRNVAEDKEPPNKKNINQDKTKDGTKTSVADQKRDFQAKYVQGHQLGVGGCGAVFDGYRIIDNFPVAIKRIPKGKVYCKVTDENGKQLSVEVAIMLKLAAEADGSVGSSAPVSLLEWFDFGRELILVLERPVPAVDLHKYVEENGGPLPEDQAKVILKQLVDAAKELEEKHIFHRDIKCENILIETGSDVPRVRIIDFGLSCFFKERSLYRTFYGTPDYIPPELFLHNCYRSGPTTVWQLGVVLYEVLHARDFNTFMFFRKELKINKHHSRCCRKFLKSCLAKFPEKRPTLEDLQHHAWLRGIDCF